MEDDGLGLSLGIKCFEKRRPQTPPPTPSLPPVLTPPLKHSISVCCRRLAPERLGFGGSKTTKQLAPYTTTMQNLGWMSAKPKPRSSHKGLDGDISKILPPNSELSMCVGGGKRSAKREVIISDGEDGGDADHRGDVGVGVADAAREAPPHKKKLRLSKEQSSLLEQTFLEDSTLNNKQKLYLAKELKLMPRQVEVWFQNRRARTKLKQTEVDCEFLREYCKRLLEENRRLQKEIQQLTPHSALSLCQACNRGSTPSSASLIDTTIRPVDQPNVSASLFNKASLLKI